MLLGLELTGVVLLLAATLKIGQILSDNIEDALGEKPLRDRSAEEI